jgi:hypothetical protein
MNRNARSTARDTWKLSVLGAAVAVAVGLACSTESASSPKPVTQSPASNHAATLKNVATVVPQPVEPPRTPAPKKDMPKLMTYRSRDYGVSFQYPWQFAYFNAKTIANGDESLRPSADGHDGQFTLARVEIPRGYYPDTDFESAYFTLSLNQDIAEADCSLTPAKGASLQTETINGADFHWTETTSGGHGSASRVRDYVSFVNEACYEIEIGLKTSNQDGLAREVNSQQVFGRLEGILRSIKVDSALKDAPAQLQTAAAAPAQQK